MIMAMVEAEKKMKGSGTASAIQGREQAVEFTYYAPAAKKVCLAGKFNSWNTNSLPMKKGKDGMWRISIKLQPGKHEYKYFIDNAWAQDLPCSDKVPNPFGTYNCIRAVA
jgi:1,4-alpha-glucan branching enzyme